MMNSALAIGLGRFFFRRRNVLGPAVFLLALVLSEPRYPFGSQEWNVAFDLAGAALALAGEGLRVLTIGYEYIVRGGRDRQVYAEHLVERGVFAQCRNPMYVANVLIGIGLALVIHAYAFYLIVIPSILIAYASIVAAEEAYLRRRFGAEYERYAARVNRWWPRLAGFRASTRGLRFSWRRVLVKEYTTVFCLVGTIACLRLWSEYRVAGAEALPSPAGTGIGLCVWIALYIAVRALKKSGYVADRRAGSAT
jgi:protein-S-isoprenylcysteine O-methyltransferase Ste14